MMGKKIEGRDLSRSSVPHPPDRSCVQRQSHAKLVLDPTLLVAFDLAASPVKVTIPRAPWSVGGFDLRAQRSLNQPCQRADLGPRLMAGWLFCLTIPHHDHEGIVVRNERTCVCLVSLPFPGLMQRYPTKLASH